MARKGAVNMTWDEFVEKTNSTISIKVTNKEITDIECPKCKRKLYRRTDILMAVNSFFK